ncbi:hypothetical protein THII_2562 [Thioploca ingrica]|uniref:Secreted protein n=1 Tax=Thioploca ingrica TaxID=40754 RepID=A0A090AHS8_9GAMM|nr:hypothetical protein THII_2562 [Thioploca ingrica]
MRKILSSAIMMLAVASSASVEAAAANSWNLSSDMIIATMSTNPCSPTNLLPSSFGIGCVWTAMYDAVGTSHNSLNYLMMPNYFPTYPGPSNPGPSNPFAVWTNPSQYALLVGVATQTYNASNGTSNFTHIQGIPTLHPDTTLSSIIRWKSPINGNINIMGRIADVDSACGNGINWFVDKGNSTLMSGTLANGNNGATILQQNIPVSIGTYLYFIVSPKNNDNLCDTTYLDIIITNP